MVVLLPTRHRYIPFQVYLLPTLMLPILLSSSIILPLKTMLVYNKNVLREGIHFWFRPAEPGNIVTRGSSTANTVVKEHTGYARAFYTIWTSSHINRSLLYKPSMSKPKLNVNSNTNVKTPTQPQPVTINLVQ